jgi:hypothetical protein
MSIFLLQHSKASGVSRSVSFVVAVLVALLPALLGPQQSCTGRHAGASLSSNVPWAPATPDRDGGRYLAQQGAEASSSTSGTCHTVMPEAVPARAHTGRQDSATLDSDPSVSSQPDSLPGALTVEASSLRSFASTRLSFPYPSQGPPHHLHSVVLRV